MYLPPCSSKTLIPSESVRMLKISSGVCFSPRPALRDFLAACSVKKKNQFAVVRCWFFFLFSVTFSYFHDCNWFVLENNIRPPAILDCAFGTGLMSLILMDSQLVRHKGID